MKIAFLGNFSVDYTTETHHLKTLRKLGHEVFPLQEGIDTADQIFSRASKMDMLFWTHTHERHTQGIDDVLKKLKELNIPTVGYHLDLWLGLEREKDLANDPYWNIEYFFSVDMLMVEYLNQHENMPKAFFLPAGVYEEECYIAPTNPAHQHDIVFVGSGIYHKEWEYRQDLVNFLHIKYGRKFAHYGEGGIRKVRGAELNSIYANSKIVIGDTLCKGYNYPWYLSDRIFEVTGRGGFIIHPFIEGIETMFEVPVPMSPYDYDTTNAEIITYPFAKWDYLEYLIDYYLAEENKEEREEIRDRGHKRTLENHTYTNRLFNLLNIIENERRN